MKNRQRAYIIGTIFLFSILVTLTDALLHPDYFVKISVKIPFFLLLPLLFFAWNRREIDEFKKMFLFQKRGLLASLLLGFAIYAVIVGGYFGTRNFIDFSQVVSSLTDGMGITAGNFFYVALYISLLNSFLEEFFFRGYGFITLKKYTSRKFAYLFSSSMFALYHAGMLVGMFHPAVLLLLFLGLAAGGCIFDFLNERHGNLYPSWFVHMFADLAIATVGAVLFGLL